MENKRPVKWWLTTPKIKGNKVMCVAIDQSGEETTSWFTLEELETHLTKRAADSPKAGGKSAKRKVVKAKVSRCLAKELFYETNY